MSRSVRSRLDHAAAFDLRSAPATPERGRTAVVCVFAHGEANTVPDSDPE
jgi:hypothetical protein